MMKNSKALIGLLFVIVVALGSRTFMKRPVIEGHGCRGRGGVYGGAYGGGYYGYPYEYYYSYPPANYYYPNYPYYY